MGRVQRLLASFGWPCVLPRNEELCLSMQQRGPLIGCKHRWGDVIPVPGLPLWEAVLGCYCARQAKYGPAKVQSRK